MSKEDNTNSPTLSQQIEEGFRDLSIMLAAKAIRNHLPKIASENIRRIGSNSIGDLIQEKMEIEVKAASEADSEISVILFRKAADIGDIAAYISNRL